MLIRFWKWDIALHTTSGLLLGTFGFLLVYVLNENANVELSLKPRFVALFAFLFAVAVGAEFRFLTLEIELLF